MNSDEIQAKYDAKFRELEQRSATAAAGLQSEGEELEKDAKQPFKFELSVKWKDKKMSLDLPQFAMRTKELKFDVPQVSMKTRRIVFHTPSIRMVVRVIGKYPEFRGFPPKITWREIKTKVPETFMEKQEIKLDIPEFRFDTTSVKLDLPDIRMERTDFTIKVPEAVVGDISFIVPIDDDNLQARSQRLKERGERLARELQDEASAMVLAMQAEIQASAQTSAFGAANGSASAASEAFSEARSKLVDALAKVDAVLGSENGARLDDEARAALVGNRKEIADAIERLGADMDRYEAEVQAEMEEIED